MSPSSSTHEPAPSPAKGGALRPPADGLTGLVHNLRHDLGAGFMVALIALPLCLGISMASGFPPVAGLFTAIVGGLVVSLFMGSRVTIKGPAAGLIVIALGCVQELGGGDPAAAYPLALAVVVAAGLVQVVLGLVRAGVLADYFPAAAVHGMLAAIGVIIAAKQLHVMVGLDPVAKTPLGQLAELPSSAIHENPEIALIGVLSLLILVVLPRVRIRALRAIPAPLLVLIAAIPLGVLFDLEHDHIYLFAGVEYRLGPGLLVSHIDSLASTITTPDFSQIATWTSMKWVIAFALVGTIESIASAKAIDALDPWKRKSDFNRDLLAVGVGNTLAGLIGGLPMISEIVRSSANLANGGRTRWANFFHGACLLAAVALAPGLLHMIPRAALAAMLVYTGFRLAHPREFVHAWRLGRANFAVFMITIAVTLGEDLLVGIFAGIASGVLLHLAQGAPLRGLFRPRLEVVEVNADTTRIVVHGSALFTNFVPIQRAIARVAAPRAVLLDLADTRLVDDTVIDRLGALQRDFEAEGRVFTVAGLDRHQPVANDPMATRRRAA